MRACLTKTIRQGREREVSLTAGGRGGDSQTQVGMIALIRDQGQRDTHTQTHTDAGERHISRG